MEEMKTCIKCNNSYPANLRGWHSRLCPYCKCEYEKQYRLDHLEEKRARDRELYKLRTDEQKKQKYEYNKQWIKEHPENVKAWSKKKYWKDPEKSREIKRQWYYENKEYSYTRSRNWITNHRAEANQMSLKSYYKRKENNPSFRIEVSLRSRFYSVLKNKFIKTRNHAKDIIGCTFEQLRYFLEGQFENWMTWDNYGTEWEIDHIRPCSSFDLSDLEQQKECFNYKNLRPLSIHENRSKGSKIIDISA